MKNNMREKHMKKSEQGVRDLWDTIKNSKMYIMIAPEEEE